MMFILVVIYTIFLPCQGALTTFVKTSTNNSFANPISFESVLSGQYLAKHMNATWMSDYELIYRDEDVSVELITFLVFILFFFLKYLLYVVLLDECIKI